MSEQWYRYYDMEISCDPRMYGIYLETFTVLRHTPKGVWLALYAGDEKGKFVLNGKGKRYAYNNKEDAMESYKIRRQRRVRYLKRDLERAERTLALAEAGEFKERYDGHFTFLENLS